MTILVLIALVIGLVLLSNTVGKAVLMIQDIRRTQSVILSQVTATRADVLAELDFVRSQLADYIGNELLEKRVLPTIGYREESSPIESFKKLVRGSLEKL
jgi:hypothetical protein